MYALMGVFGISFAWRQIARRPAPFVPRLAIEPPPNARLAIAPPPNVVSEEEDRDRAAAVACFSEWRTTSGFDGKYLLFRPKGGKEELS